MKRIATLSGLFMASLLVACSNPAADKPAAEVSAPQPEPAAQPAPPAGQPAAQGEQLPVAPPSTVNFTGSKVTGSHEGGFSQFNGAITLVDGKPETSQVRVEIDTTSVWTDNEKLTNHLKSPDFFDVEKFPRASFVSTKIEPQPDKAGAYTVTGNLDLHGVQKSITFPASITVTPEAVSVQSEFVINRKDFGIVYAGKPDDLIRDEVVMKLNLQSPRTGQAGSAAGTADTAGTAGQPAAPAGTAGQPAAPAGSTGQPTTH